jgi:hypothetical protein
MRLLRFFVTVSIVGATGAFTIEVLASTARNESQSVHDAAAGLFYLLAIGSPVAAAVMVAYGLLATAIAGIIRRPVWWAGIVSGLIPALVLTAVFWSSSSGGTSYYDATAAEVSSANTINAIASALTIVWCTISAAALLPLTARYSTRKTRTVSDRWQT